MSDNKTPNPKKTDKAAPQMPSKTSDKSSGKPSDKSSAGAKPANIKRVKAKRASGGAPKTRSLIFILPLAIIAGLAAGVFGGFAAYKYLAPPPPDLSGLTAQIDQIEKNVIAEAQQRAALEAMLTRKISQLETQIANVEARPLNDIISDSALDITPDIADSEPASSGANPASNKAPSVVTGLPQFKAAVNKELSRIKTRLRKLEAHRDAGELASTQNSGGQIPDIKGSAIKGSALDSSDLDFPLDDILTLLGPNDSKAPAKPSAAPNWWRKLLNQHISVKRTDRDAAHRLLTDIKTAAESGKWDQASQLSAGLPKGAKHAAQEWIAERRP